MEFARKTRIVGVTLSLFFYFVLIVVTSKNRIHI